MERSGAWTQARSDARGQRRVAPGERMVAHVRRHAGHRHPSRHRVVVPGPRRGRPAVRPAGAVRQGARATRLRPERVSCLLVPPGAAERLVRPLPFTTRAQRAPQRGRPRDDRGGGQLRQRVPLLPRRPRCRAAAELGDPVLGERISYDWRRADLDPRRGAICAYAEKLTLRPREVTRADLQTLSTPA